MSKTTNKFSPEVRERAVRMVSEHRADYRSEWDALVSIAGKTGKHGGDAAALVPRRSWPARGTSGTGR